MAAHKWFALVFVAAALPFIAAVDFQSNGSDEFEWEIVTAKNFSSQIRLHPYVILLVTVPWCGESRSLMREISHKLTKEQHEYSSLKLMVLHSNVDKVLANSLDASEGITVLCYHHAMSYRYLGSLRAPAILSSIHYLMSAAPEELPLKTLTSSEDLDEFLASTDKAVLLLESCGWSYKLLVQHYGNKSLQGGIYPELLDEETNSTLASGRHKNLKEVTNKMTSCEVEDMCSRSPWVGIFSAENGTTSPTDEDIHPAFGTSCNFEEYKKFESFFLKFVESARDLYLPPQRQRYGLVSQRLLLSPLGVEVSDQWSLVISYAGCPDCLVILKEENHIHDALERHDLPVVELDNRGEYLGPSLPVNKPSVLLFIDRTSDSVETRRRSQEALNAFKEVALQHWKPNEVEGENSAWPRKTSLHTHQESTNMLESHRLLLSPSSQKSDKKMSIMILNEGQQHTLNNEALNLEGSSFQEILTRLVVQRNQLKLKLSSLAKEAGFQLLSDDTGIKLADMPSNPQSQNQDSTENSAEASNEVINDMNKDEMDKIPPMEQQGDQHEHSVGFEAPDTDTERKAPADVASKESSFLDPGQSLSTDEVAYPLESDPKMQTYVLSEKLESVDQHFSGVSGSFLFTEFNYQLLRSLTNESTVPRIVIVDPISQQHYVLLEVTNLTSKSISTFIEGYLNGTVIPYQRSGPSPNSIQFLQPPFVNLDFHEKDSIPSVTTRMFSELVLGSDGHGDQNETNTWHKDVVVLFSNSWCGFCQRMELVVHEVYRAFKSYGSMVNTDSKDKEKLSGENFKDNTARLPAFYSIDCTLNDCGGILRSVGQSEVYPTLLLFPAESKTPIPYDGNMMATDVIKFIANHGSNRGLSKHEGTLWIDEGEREGHDDQFKGTFTSGDTAYFPHLEDNYIGAVLKNSNSKDQPKFNPNEKARPTIRLGSFLIATDHLHGLNPFNKAKILIVGANHELGFQGLMVNKPISWDLVQFEDAKLYELLKDAPLSFGGPVIQETSPFVSLTKSCLDGQYPRVLTDMYFLDPLATVKEIEKIKAGNRNATDYWFFWGYSGWSWDQLFGEIDGGSWNLYEGEPKDLQWP